MAQIKFADIVHQPFAQRRITRRRDLVEPPVAAGPRIVKLHIVRERRDYILPANFFFTEDTKVILNGQGFIEGFKYTSHVIVFDEGVVHDGDLILVVN